MLLETGGPAYLAGYAAGTLAVVWAVYRLARWMLGDMVSDLRD